MKNKKIVVSVLGILGIVLATIGVTYAFFSYSKTGTKENRITSGKVTFLFTEASQGITLTDAMPMTDTEGKAQTGEGKVFDFRVTSSVGTNMRIPYTVTVKQESSVIPAEYIKLYLTDQLDNEIEPVRTLSSLDNYTNTITGLTGEKVLYEGEVQAGNSNYNKLFRLRMWIADNIDMNEGNTGIGTYNGASFSIKVNVYSIGEATNQTEAERRANASIESVTVNGNDVEVIDDTHFESTIRIAEGETSTTVPIVVDTVNDNATVRIEEISTTRAVVKENKVKPVAVSKNMILSKGTHNLKITVIPEDKSNPTIFYLAITVTDVPLYSFATDSWSTIQANVKAGKLTDYNLDMINGVTRDIILDGDPIIHKLRIANISSCANALDENPNLTSTTACGFVVEFADIIDNKKMNTSDINIGGYPGTNVMYNYVTNTVYNKLPADLRAVIQDTVVVSSRGKNEETCDTTLNNRDSNCNFITIDKLYLLDTKEVLGSNTQVDKNTAYAKTRQLDYYIGKSDNDRIKVKRSSNSDINGSASTWWLRTTSSDGINCFATDHIVKYWCDYASSSYGVSPAFRIGPLPADANSN